MKGMVFTEFLEMVDETFSPEMTDHIIDASELMTGGAYTTVGTYDYGEMVQLVGHLSTRTGMPVADLMRVFGQHLFGRFSVLYPNMFTDIHSVIDFLKKIDGYIHVEVRKLYADAELPIFSFVEEENGRFALTYRSKRPFADLAEGLITGCMAHYGENLVMQREDLSSPPGTHARFVVYPAGRSLEEAPTSQVATG
jgi:hypothetical protein